MHEPPYPDPRDRSAERWREAPRTVAPAPAPRASPVPLGRARVPVTATAAVQPAATLACPIVSALDRWIVDSVQPAAMRWFNQPVVEIRQISAYSCRGMNGQPGARISEHAFGNALDIAAFTLGRWPQDHASRMAGADCRKSRAFCATFRRRRASNSRRCWRRARTGFTTTIFTSI